MRGARFFAPRIRFAHSIVGPDQAPRIGNEREHKRELSRLLRHNQFPILPFSQTMGLLELELLDDLRRGAMGMREVGREDSQIVAYDVLAIDEMEVVARDHAHQCRNRKSVPP